MLYPVADPASDHISKSSFAKIICSLKTTTCDAPDISEGVDNLLRFPADVPTNTQG